MFFRFLASLRPRETLFSATSIKVLLDHCLFLEQNSKGKKWCAKTRISALGYRVSRLAALLLTIICWYSGHFLPIFNSLAVQVSGTIALVLDRNSASHLSVKQYHKPIQSEHSYRLKCVQSEPLFYTRNTRNCMVYHSGYLLLRNSISPSETLLLHSLMKRLSRLIFAQAI